MRPDSNIQLNILVWYIVSTPIQRKDGVSRHLVVNSQSAPVIQFWCPVLHLGPVLYCSRSMLLLTSQFNLKNFQVTVLLSLVTSHKIHKKFHGAHGYHNIE